MTEIEQAIFDIIKEPITLGSVDDLGVISDSDALAKAQKITAAALRLQWERYCTLLRHVPQSQPAGRAGVK